MNNLFYGSLKSYKRHNNSVNGNPCFTVEIVNEDGDVLEGRTGRDAQAGYYPCFDTLDKSAVFEYHTTRNGAVIIDRVHFTDYIYEAFNAGGYRERYAMLNGKINYIGDLVKFTYNKHEEYQDANGATYSRSHKAWIN